MTHGIASAKMSRQSKKIGLLFEVGATMPDRAER